MLYTMLNNVCRKLAHKNVSQADFFRQLPKHLWCRLVDLVFGLCSSCYYFAKKKEKKRI